MADIRCLISFTPWARDGFDPDADSDPAPEEIRRGGAERAKTEEPEPDILRRQSVGDTAL